MLVQLKLTSGVLHSGLPVLYDTYWVPGCKGKHETTWLCVPVPSVPPSSLLSLVVS